MPDDVVIGMAAMADCGCPGAAMVDGSEAMVTKVWESGCKGAAAGDEALPTGGDLALGVEVSVWTACTEDCWMTSCCLVDDIDLAE